MNKEKDKPFACINLLYVNKKQRCSHFEKIIYSVTRGFLLVEPEVQALEGKPASLLLFLSDTSLSSRVTLSSQVQ